jgi:DNA-directed RNA polymerase subunit L
MSDRVSFGVHRVPAIYPPMEDDDDEDEDGEMPVRQRVHAASGLLMGPPIEWRSTDGLSSTTRKGMDDYITGSNVLQTLKRVRYDHEDDPEASAWEHELQLEKKEHAFSNAMRSEMVKGFQVQVVAFDLTHSERKVFDKLMNFVSSLKDTIDNLTKSVYQKGCRGMLIMHRKHDELINFDRKLQRRDLRAEKLEGDKVSGVRIMREIHTKLIDSNTALKAANSKGLKQEKTFDAVMLMMQRARCTVCRRKILIGRMMKCKTSLCEDCERHGSCPCSIPHCESVYHTRAANFMDDMLWVMELVEMDAVTTDVEKSVKDYIKEDFERRSSAQRMSPEL